MTPKIHKKALPLRLTIENYQHISLLAQEDDPTSPSMNSVINKLIEADRKRIARRQKRKLISR